MMRPVRSLLHHPPLTGLSNKRTQYSSPGRGGAERSEYSSYCIAEEGAELARIVGGQRGALSGGSSETRTGPQDLQTRRQSVRSPPRGGQRL